MKYYKLNNEVFAFEEDGSQDHLIHEQFVEMTALEVKQHVSTKQRETDVWDDVKEEWVDGRTTEQIEVDRLAAFEPLSRRQFKLGLHDFGLATQIDTAIASVEDPDLRLRLQIEYAESDRFIRNSPAVLQMIGLLGLTTEQVDAMWTQALTY